MNEIKIAAGESKQVQIKATKEGWLDSAIAEYNYTVLEGKVATPAIVPDEVISGKFTITCATSGASIYYTIDGSTPDNTDTPYTDAVTLEATATVKAIAYKTDWAPSAVASQEIEVLEIFEPPIANVESWYEANADDFVVGETNTTWVDKISKGKAFSVANASAPTLSTDKLVFVADNSNILERADDGLSDEGNITVAAVIKFTGTSAADQKVWGCHLGAGKMASGWMTGSLTVLRMSPAGNTLSVNASATEVQSGYKLMIWNYISAGTSKVDGFKCGAEDADITVSGASGTANFGTNSLFLGRHATTAAEYLNAEIKAIIIVKGTIGVDDLAALKTYCTTNYGADI